MKRILLLLFFVLVENICFSQTLYDYELKRDNPDTSIFSVYARANQGATDAVLAGSSFGIFLPTGVNIGNFSSVTGTDWSTTILVTGSQLNMQGFDDGTRDFFSIGNSSDDAVVFSHGTAEFLLCTFQVLSIPPSGDIEIASNEDPVVMSLTNAGLNVGNSFTIDPNDGMVGGDLYNGLIGTTTFILNAPTLSNNTFSKSTFSLTPNPNNGQFTITSALPLGETTLTIYNIGGQQVYRTVRNTFGKNELSVNLAQKLAVGAYLIKMESQENATMIKMVVQ